MTKRTVTGVAAVLAALAAGPASAEILVMTFSGTVHSDSENNAFGFWDATDVFAGGAFSSSFTADTSNSYFYLVEPTFQELYDGAFYGDGLTPALSSTATFGGHTISFSGNWAGVLFGASGVEKAASTNSRSDDATLSMTNAAYIGGVSGRPAMQSGTGLGEAAVYVAHEDPETGDVSLFTLDAIITGVTVTDSAPGILSVATPEPATWAMMALGFAGLGFAGWRKVCPTPFR